MPTSSADPARRLAYDVVVAVDTDGAYANLLLARLSRERGISGRDAAFAAELAYGTLRWQGVLDVVVEAAARRGVDAMDPPVRAVVRLGAYQLLHMRVPDRAAVHSTVELARAVAGPKPVGFVNAVLRKVAQASWPQWCDRLAPADDLGAVAFRHGYPRWIAAEFARSLGDPGDLPAALAEDRPATHLVARPGRVDRDELLAEAGPGAEPGPWSPYAVRLAAGGDPGALASVRSGAAGVQDEGSQLVAVALASTDGEATRWLDACAGPGGKAALLHALLPPGATLVAADRREHRARLVARALPEHAPVVVADATRPPWPDGAFDRVLVDVPCSGLGALRRRPEVRWRRDPDDLPQLRRLQEAILLAAVDATKPGGVVGYATCSPVLAETTEVVAAVEARRPGLQRIDPFRVLPGLKDQGAVAQDGSSMQLWPHRHGTDAMFLALLRLGDS